MKSLRNIAIAAGAAAVLFSGTALASPGKEHGHGMKHGCAHGQMHEKMAHRMQERLADVKAELNLTAAQEPAWQAFEDTVRSRAETHKTMRGTSRTDGDPLEASIAHMEQRLAGMKEIAKARQELYQTLTAEQKAIAERLFQRHGRPNA